MTASVFEHDQDIIIIRDAESLNYFDMKMNKNKNLLILYYLLKKLSKFSDAQKKVFHAFSFQLCSRANSKFSFYISLCEINCIKIQTMSLVLNMSILAGILYLLLTLPATERKVQVRARFKKMLVCRHLGLFFEYIRPVGKKKILISRWKR